MIIYHIIEAMMFEIIYIQDNHTVRQKEGTVEVYFSPKFRIYVQK